jgi:hypothetical protein
VISASHNVSHDVLALIMLRQVYYLLFEIFKKM